MFSSVALKSASVALSERTYAWLRNVTCVREAKTKDVAASNETEALALLSSLGLTEADAHALPDELSGGMKQRVSIARALFSPHPIKLLDEVTKELDPASVERVLEQIAITAKNSLVLFSTHHPEDCVELGATRVELPSLN